MNRSIEKRPKSIRIVMAEDDPLLCQLVPALLRAEEDLQIVETVADGLAVPEVVARLRPHVLLLDLNLPGCHGLELLNQVWTLGVPTRVLVLTAEADERISFEAARRGVHGFVLKQEAAPVLAEALRTVAAGKVWFPQGVVDTRSGECGASVTRVWSSEDPISQLSEREREVLTLVARGHTNSQIAAEIRMSTSMVKTHLRSVFQKLDLPNRTEAAVFALRQGLITARR